ncbi:hypothetical protein [Micromonospora rubida]|uniref:hypothetical protein n=1 Tax=Micromonospora rubida TaxID=2697657 RepID=UPI00137864AF|nr:hypothetical protein [Micromonospora rubida]NBE80133.1 hypothetical protein [Micromonospora rubida]
MPGTTAPVNGPARSPGPFTVLARLASSDALPTGERANDGLGGYRPALRRLLRDLGHAHGVRYAALWLPVADNAARPQWTPAVAWQHRHRGPGPALPDRADDPDLLLTSAGVAATVDVTDGGARCGVLVLAHRQQPGPRSAPAALLGETAVCVGLLLRLARNRAAGAAARSRAEGAARQADVVRLELSAVQAVERDRLATAVTVTPERQLRAILTHARALEGALTGGSPEAETIAATIRAGLHEMIEGFRTVVRGVYPQVLRGGGVAAALAEIAASLSVPVGFHGELGRRQSWEVESTLYQAAASAMAALSACGGDEPLSVELSQDGDVLTIQVQGAEVERPHVAAVLRDDSRRLAALGGRLSVDEAPGRAATVVGIRLPQRFGGDWPETARTAVPVPAGRAGAPDGLPGEDTAAGAPVRRLLGLLVDRREGPSDSVPVRVALGRQDRRARVVVVGAESEQLMRVLCGPPGDTGWAPPDAAGGVPICYGYGPHRRITLRPVRGAPPWRAVRAPDWSGVGWPDAAAGLDRILVEIPADALRGLRLGHCRDRVDVDLAVRLRRWSDGAYGLPDAVLLALGGPASAAESEFLTVLRAPGRDGFSPVVISAMREGAAASSGSRQWLRTMSDEVVDWHPAAEGGRAVDEALRTRLPAATGVLAARWALRALVACHAAGQLNDELAHAVDAAVAGAYQVAELDLLQALQGWRITLPRGHDDALRLLGAHGTDTRSRAGLTGDADAEQVIRAAGQALAFWRAQCIAPDRCADIRAACAVLVRACERLVVDGGRLPAGDARVCG